jgi:hypothetical protein
MVVSSRMKFQFSSVEHNKNRKFARLGCFKKKLKSDNRLQNIDFNIITGDDIDISDCLD